MTKKGMALLLTLVMLFSCAVPVSADKAEKANLLVNCDMETTVGGKITNWNCKGDAGDTYEVATDIVHGGKQSIKVTDAGSNTYMCMEQTVKIVPGETYSVEGYCYPVDLANGGAAIKVEMYRMNDNGKTEYIDKVETDYKALKKNAWNKIGFEVTAPKECVQFIVLFRMNMGACLYFDDLALNGAKPEVGEPLADKNYVPLPAGEKELLTNASFEELDENGYPKNWEAYKGWSKDSASIQFSQDGGYDGENTIDIIGSGNPWVRQLIYRPFKKGEVYQISAWFRIQSSGKIGAKLEYHDAEDIYMGGDNTEGNTTATGEQWAQYVYHMTIPNDCERVSFYIRNFDGGGAVEIDSASFYRIKAPAAVCVDTDEVFYYTEEAEAGKYGHIEALINQEQYPELAGLPVSFRIKDGATVVYEKTGIMPDSLAVTHDFRISVLKEEWKEYTLEVAAVGADGKDAAVESISIYKYPRPTYLNEKGKVILPDGKEINPAMWYHVEIKDYPQLAAAGGTVVQSRYETPDGILSCLEAAEDAGLMVMAALYRGMLPAGHPNNVENTTTIIEKVKDHPALLGYMVMDEPSSNFSNKPELFEDSYKLIRTLDPNHIVYMVEASPEYY
ncbi:MAG: carbohydrate binding domain-containing protein, partial [Clostridia bacterium]|nr:carbohydrate binding domain-containing protein [Clostridia bacterium]